MRAAPSSQRAPSQPMQQRPRTLRTADIHQAGSRHAGIPLANRAVGRRRHGTWRQEHRPAGGSLVAPGPGSLLRIS